MLRVQNLLIRLRIVFQPASRTGAVNTRWLEYIILRQPEHQELPPKIPSFKCHYLFTYSDVIHLKLAPSILPLQSIQSD